MKGSIVATYDPGTRLYYLGSVAGDYRYRPELNDHLQHTRAVRWTRTVARDLLTVPTKNSLGSISPIFCISPEAALEIRADLESPPNLSQSKAIEEESVAEAEAEIRKDTEQRAIDFLQDKLSRFDGYEMQDLVAGLLRAMGYRTTVSPRGPDRGRDIVASPDAFGFQTPRIIVEVKHRVGQVGAPLIRSFIGGLRPGDNGLYVSTGGFSKEARYEADRCNHPITLMDSENLGCNIVENYDNMDMETRILLPLKKIYWPA